MFQDFYNTQDPNRFNPVKNAAVAIARKEAKRKCDIKSETRFKNHKHWIRETDVATLHFHYEGSTTTPGRILKSVTLFLVNKGYGL